MILLAVNIFQQTTGLNRLAQFQAILESSAWSVSKSLKLAFKTANQTGKTEIDHFAVQADGLIQQSAAVEGNSWTHL